MFNGRDVLPWSLVSSKLKPWILLKKSILTPFLTLLAFNNGNNRRLSNTFISNQEDNYTDHKWFLFHLFIDVGSDELNHLFRTYYWRYSIFVRKNVVFRIVRRPHVCFLYLVILVATVWLKTMYTLALAIC